MPNDPTRFQHPAVLNFSGHVRFDLADISAQRVTDVIETGLSEILMAENMLLSLEWEFTVEHQEDDRQD
jgi:hypothetical protein